MQPSVYTALTCTYQVPLRSKFDTGEPFLVSAISSIFTVRQDVSYFFLFTGHNLEIMPQNPLQEFSTSATTKLRSLISCGNANYDNV